MSELKQQFPRLRINISALFVVIVLVVVCSSYQVRPDTTGHRTPERPDDRANVPVCEFIKNT